MCDIIIHLLSVWYIYEQKTQVYKNYDPSEPILMFLSLSFISFWELGRGKGLSQKPSMSFFHNHEHEAIDITAKENSDKNAEV